MSESIQEKPYPGSKVFGPHEPLEHRKDPATFRIGNGVECVRDVVMVVDGLADLPGTHPLVGAHCPMTAPNERTIIERLSVRPGTL